MTAEPLAAPWDTVLVANRGEIACRIIRSARALGLGTVAVYSDADRGAAHVRLADRAVHLGPPPAEDSYLRADAIVESALATGAGAVHPGYGFLSENSDFAQRVDDAGLVFVGPTPSQLALFGAKHAARQAASAAGVPLLPGTDLLTSVEDALAAAETIGYPVMVKATGGGGGIGIQPCTDPGQLAEAFDAVSRAALTGFGVAGVFVERLVVGARHVEVQVVGDGGGGVVVLGDRDCTLQRRRQKVIEEAPAPNLPDHVRDAIAAGSARLAASVRYRSVGTVEYVYDAERAEAAFLEVNARLQVEHPVTEAVWGVDLVGLMFRIAAGEPGVLDALRDARPCGHAVEARLYAEDARRGYLPSSGLITGATWPGGVRVDTWVEPGTEVTTFYDPLLAKVVATSATREGALDQLAATLDDARVAGIETNRTAAAAALRHPHVRTATHTTATLTGVEISDRRIDVERAGMQTTVQDWPGRLGYWHVGVPPSGPMDDRSFRLGNSAVGNPEGAPGLEATLSGPALRFSTPTLVCVTGAPSEVLLDGEHVPMWEPVLVPPGGLLEIGAVGPPGIRAYVAFDGGLDVPESLGSASTFTLGGFGGHGGRALRTGDVLRNTGTRQAGEAGRAVPAERRPAMGTSWQLRVVPGPHADSEFFTSADIDMLYDASWEVHFNSARTGVRLIGPRPGWARPDGGEAGLHPSNIHDTPYPLGAIDFTGDVPILLGPDGPSLGGFVCPATVLVEERWKLGQLRPGDRVQFAPERAPVVGFGGADMAERPPAAAWPRPRRWGIERAWTRQTPQRPSARPGDSPAAGLGGDTRDRSGILARSTASDGTVVTYRSAGNDNLLVEYGPMVLDLGLRARVHVLGEHLAALQLDGVIDLTPGVRGLLVHIDPAVSSVEKLIDVVGDLEWRLPPSDALEVPSREIHLPLSWDDPATREAIARYMAGVRDDAPWCPWNIEFIRRVNGLADVSDVHRIVYDASYLVLGLGDVYLGAPLATPVDPRHRLVTTKYNPARTWTAENSVGIGGAYLCIYGMEGPGGYQFVGRTIQVWSRFCQRPPFEAGIPWLLRFFDRIRWYPVGAEELLDARADMAAGRFPVRIEEGTFRLADYRRMLDDNAESIADFRQRQSAAFAAERSAWERAGEFQPRPEPVVAKPEAVTVPPGGTVVESPMTGSVWKVDVGPGEEVAAGRVLVIVEAMKTEVSVPAPCAGVIAKVLAAPGDHVLAGGPLILLASSESDAEPGCGTPTSGPGSATERHDAVSGVAVPGTQGSTNA